MPQHPALPARRIVTLDDIRRHAVARTLFKPTTLGSAIERLGFVQADPIRAPARAQDLTLRHRVAGYRAGDLERRYPALAVEEDFFINHGYLPRGTHALMHPRTARTVWSAERWDQAHAVLAFVREHGTAHPRDVDTRFAHGRATNWFGGSTNASTQLLDGMHYRGLVRIARREGGVRIYAERSTAAPQAGAATADPAAVLDALVDVLLRTYAPLPGRSLSELVLRLRVAVPQWGDHRTAALARARARLPHARVDGVDWYWPADESPASRRHASLAAEGRVRLLAPFDPIVWDRRRFELLWGWAYRFEAYTPAPKRIRGYYALPLLWGDRVVGWANVAVQGGALQADIGHVDPQATDNAVFRAALDDELQRMSAFLGLA